MKRYELINMNEEWDHDLIMEMAEDPNGGWVKWEDVKDAMPMWESISNMNPSQFATFIQALTKGKIKCEGRYEEQNVMD